jgi:hypothetical protein
MSFVATIQDTFPDPLVPALYGDVVIPEQEWAGVAGVGVPEDGANVTGDHIFRQTTQPTPEQGAKNGDYWIDTATSNKPYKQVDGVWTSVQDTGAALASVGAGKWSQNLVFSVTDFNTVAWGTGTITLPDGTSYTIVAGDSGKMLTQQKTRSFRLSEDMDRERSLPLTTLRRSVSQPMKLPPIQLQQEK